MNRIGRSASGGTIEMTATNEPSSAFAAGSSPITMPNNSAAAVEIAERRDQPFEAGPGIRPDQIAAGAGVDLKRHLRSPPAP